MAKLLSSLVLLLCLIATTAYGGAFEPEFYAVRTIFYEDDQIGKLASQASQSLSADKITLAQARDTWGKLLDRARTLRDAAPKRLEKAWAAEEPRSRRLTEYTNDLATMLDFQVDRLQGLQDAAGIEQAQGRSAAESAWKKQRASVARYVRMHDSLKERIERKYRSTP